MKNAFELDHTYGKNGLLDETGLSTLMDMHATLTNKNWNRAEAIEYVASNHRCHKDTATAMIDWALNIFRRDTPDLVASLKEIKQIAYDAQGEWVSVSTLHKPVDLIGYDAIEEKAAELLDEAENVYEKKEV